ncbi:hypothetical protein [Klebsiella variicola]|uniref:hypothetical protein n=1 Tax=Klebsiella variicola TaxID=244366 RepID=UPI00164A797C|nr:hypothetical protein [Klebsiella variicola]MBC5035811.1 hypothetical protein [Klebsiella variicola]
MADGVEVNLTGLDSVLGKLDARVLRDAIEGKAYITRWGEQSRDPETMRYRYSFDVDWITTR